MTETIRDSTGDPIGDKIVRGVIGIFEQAFPGRVSGYFLRGSYASSARTEGSDLDMFVVFEEAFAGTSACICPSRRPTRTYAQSCTRRTTATRTRRRAATRGA